MRPYVLQASLFAALGMGAYTLKRFGSTPLHPILLRYPELVQMYPMLASNLSQFSQLGDDDGLEEIVRRVVEIVRLDASPDLSAQWHISRMNSELIKDVERWCCRTPRAHSDERFRAVLTCTDELLPQLIKHLDDLLHNHILAHTTV